MHSTVAESSSQLVSYLVTQSSVISLDTVCVQLSVLALLFVIMRFFMCLHIKYNNIKLLPIPFAESYRHQSVLSFSGRHLSKKSVPILGQLVVTIHLYITTTSVFLLFVSMIYILDNFCEHLDLPHYLQLSATILFTRFFSFIKICSS